MSRDRPGAEATGRPPSSHGSVVRLHDRPWWPMARRLATGAFFALVAWLIVASARTIDWSNVLRAVDRLPPLAIATAIVLTVCSDCVYSLYDLLGRRITGHTLPTRTVMRVTFVSYAFNLNLGSLVGSVGLRYRLYARLGLDQDVIARLIGFAILTNWIGYLALAGITFSFGAIALPSHWRIDSGELRVVGIVAMLLAVAYLASCAIAGRRVWHVHGHALPTPSWRIGVLQIAVSATNWSLMGTVIWVLLEGQAAFLHVLAVLLVAALAGLISHVPAGLGVLETVFVALLGHEIAQDRLLGALLAYRAIYYLLPLAVACMWSVVIALRRG